MVKFSVVQSMVVLRILKTTSKNIYVIIDCVANLINRGTITWSEDVTKKVPPLERDAVEPYQSIEIHNTTSKKKAIQSITITERINW